MNDSLYIIVNMTPQWEVDLHRLESEAHTLLPCRRPKYVHEDLDSAETEALRLHKKYGGPQGRFVVFQAVQATTWRDTWTIATSPVAVLEPYATPQPLNIPERARKPRKKGKP